MIPEILSLEGFDYWIQYLVGEKLLAEMSEAYRNATGYHRYKLGNLKGHAEWITTLQRNNAHRLVLQRGPHSVCGCGLVMAKGPTPDDSMGHRFEGKVVGLFVTYGEGHGGPVQAHCQSCQLSWVVEPREWAFGGVPVVDLGVLGLHESTCVNPGRSGQR